MTEPPLLSAILATSGGIDDVHQTLHALRDQTIQSRLEVVVVAQDGVVIDEESPLLAGFCAIRICRVSDVTNHAMANAAGVREASAEHVVFCEDHCFPETDWAENLVRAQEAGADVVAPLMVNANPATAVCQADFLLAYAPWDGFRCPSRELFLPGHQCSYRRSLLLAEGESLAESLQVECFFHLRLKSQGHILRWCETARTRHVGFSKYTPAIVSQFYVAWEFSACRRQNWNIGRRILYAGASLLLPGLRGIRVAELLRHRKGRYSPLPQLFPPLLALLSVSAMGEMLGNICHPKWLRKNLGKWEFRRWDYILAGERERLFPEA